MLSSMYLTKNYMFDTVSGQNESTKVLICIFEYKRSLNIVLHENEVMHIDRSSMQSEVIQQEKNYHKPHCSPYDTRISRNGNLDTLLCCTAEPGVCLEGQSALTTIACMHKRIVVCTCYVLNGDRHPEMSGGTCSTCGQRNRLTAKTGFICYTWHCITA